MAEQTLYYGGQALIEGVMIRGPSNVAVACRRPDGEIAVRREALGGVYTGAVRRIPLLRGVIVLWETLALGMRALLFSSNVAMGEEEKEISPLSVIGMGLTALLLVAVLFFAGPVLLAGWLEDIIDSSLLVVVIEGLIRLAILLAYVGFIGLIPDIKRVYAYHGAEHKSIHALEAGDPLEPASVQRHPTAHVRCGTSFLLTVVVVSVVVFAALGSPDLWLRVVSRIALIPVIAALAYELIRLGGRFYANPLARVLMWPNLALQTLTTRQPDDAQVEVALRALREVMEAEGVSEPAAGATKANP
ncbi:MAG TPA: DUF1385 domain-containing protein [Dehalococcoidia bacterium]|nr:DUF1385 domain-containing protein [Dehalococcoidia bacterium]